MTRGTRTGKIPYLRKIGEVYYYERMLVPELRGVVEWEGKILPLRFRVCLHEREQTAALVPYAGVHLMAEKAIQDAYKRLGPKRRRVDAMSLDSILDGLSTQFQIGRMGDNVDGLIAEFEKTQYVELSPELKDQFRQLAVTSARMAIRSMMGVPDPSAMFQTQDWLEDNTQQAGTALPAPVAPAQAILPPVASMTLQNLIDVYWDSPENRDKSETKKNAKACYGLLVDVFGKDRAADSLTRADFRMFQRVCLNLPPLNFRRKPPEGFEKFAGLSMTDAADLAEELNADLEDDDRIPTLNPNSVNKYISALGQLFTFAEAEGYCRENHTLGLRVPRQKSNKSGFTVDQLKTLFPKDYDLTDPRHWVPLIALYHGCRGNEIAQLDTADVADVDGIPCFFFTANVVVGGVKTNKVSPVKSIKQLVSDRRIPVHPKLVELGFLEYVQARRDAKKEKLFDYNRYGDSYWDHARKYLGYDWLEKVKDETVSFHSFRHTFKNACRGQKFLGVNPRFVSELGGWTRGKGAEEGYGEHSPPATLLEVLKLVEYPIGL